VAVSTIDASKDDMIADLKAIAPVLKSLADAGTDLPDSLEVLLTYPFTDEVMRGVKGDYLNVYLNMAAAPGTQVIPPLVPRGTPSPSAPADGGTAARGSNGGKAAPPSGTPSRQPSPEDSSPLPLPSVTGTGTATGPAATRGGETG